MKVSAYYGPSAEIAIVIPPGRSEIWLVKLDTQEVVNEPAPHMWNLDHDPFKRAEQIEDTHPFPLVREKLDLLVRCMKTFEGMLRLIDAELSMPLRLEFAADVNKHADDPLVVAYARDIFLSVPLPDAAVIQDEALTALAPTLRAVLEETKTKWRANAA